MSLLSPLALLGPPSRGRWMDPWNGVAACSMALELSGAAWPSAAGRQVSPGIPRDTGAEAPQTFPPNPAPRPADSASNRASCVLRSVLQITAHTFDRTLEAVTSGELDFSGLASPDN